MKKRLLILIMILIALPMVFFSGCSKEAEDLAAEAINEISKTVSDETSSDADEAEKDKSDAADTSEEEPEKAEETEYVIDESGEYSDPYEVAEYLYTYHHLPSNYITKNEAEKLGWDNSKGNLWDVAEGMSIGGDHFGNYEKLLPDGDYHECDVNYEGGFRGEERLIYSDEFSIYYTQDHYKSFTQLY